MKRERKTQREKFSIGESYRGGRVEESVNLLPDEYGKLMSVLKPVIIGDGKLIPLLSHSDSEGGKHLFFYCSERGAGGYVIKVRREGEWKTIGAMREQPQCGLSLSSEEVALSDGSSITIFSWQGSRWVQRSAEGSGEISDTVRGVQHSTVSAQSGSFEVKTIGDRTVSLSESGREEIRQQLGKMYESMCGMASNSGLWIQPIVAQVRVLNGTGRVIYKGVPRVIAPQRWQCVDSISSTVTVGTGTVSIGDLRAEAAGYYLELGFSGELEAEAVSVEVVASSQIHPVNPAEESAARLVVHSSGSNITVAMPGATYNFGQRVGEWGYLLARKCATVESEGRVIARIDASAFAGGEKVRINAVPWTLSAELAQQNIVAKSGIAEPVSAAGSLGVREKINGGARWGARHCAISGSSILFADIKLSAPEPPHPLQIAGALTAYDGEWQAVTEIETAAGERMAKSFDGEGAWPSSIAPMASCAWSSTTVMRLYVELENGMVYKGEVGLTPDVSGLPFASYLDNSLKGRALEETDMSLPAESRGGEEHFPGMVVVSDASAPLVVRGERVCGSVVTGLCRSVKNRDSWEVGRSRFYAFTTQGVSAVAVSPTVYTLGATTVSEAVIEHPSACVTTPSGVYAAGGGCLWHLRGTSAVCVENDFEGKILGWCGENEQLWSVDKLGNVQIRKLRSDGGVAWRTDVPLPYAPKWMMDTSDGMIIASDVATLRHGRNSKRAAGENVKLVVGMTSPRAMRPTEFYVSMNAEHYKGRIELLADGGGGNSQARSVCELDVDGSVNQPFSVRLLCDTHHCYRLAVEGAMSADAYLEDFELGFGGW